MKLLVDGDQLSRILCKLIDKHEHISFAVAWASSGTDVINYIEKNINKVKKAIIGLHFFHTDYEVLERFYNYDQIHFIYKQNGVFHPKCYIFWTKKLNNNIDFDIIIGSANLTRGAFLYNQEACIHFSKHDTSRTLFNQIKSWVNSIWNDGKVMTHHEVQAYRNLKQKIYNKEKNFADPINSFIEKNPASLILGMNWEDFFDQVKQDQHHGDIQRLLLLTLAKQWFKKDHFNLLEEKKRRALAGTLKGKYNDLDFNWFGGNIQRQQLYNNLINNNSNIISEALDCIPIEGKISRMQYMKYAHIFNSAFPKGGDGPAIISRLISMKRPDYFVCLNNGNLPNIYNDLCILKLKRDNNNPLLRYERYWDDIIMPIQNSVWWNVKRPDDNIEGQVWDFRTALLDSIFYEPPRI